MDRDWASGLDPRRGLAAMIVLAALILVGARLAIPAMVHGISESVIWQAILSIIDALITALAVWVVTVLVSSVLQSKRARSLVEIIPSGQIRGMITQEACASSKWIVRSRTGNYFSRNTLWDLAHGAQESNRSLNLSLILMDPSDDSLLRKYVDFRGNKGLDVAKVKDDIYSTFLLLASVSRVHPRVRYRVSLLKSFWSVSIDLNDGWVMLTGPGKGEFALRASKESEFHSQFENECDALMAPRSVYVDLSDVGVSFEEKGKGGSAGRELADRSSFNRFLRQLGLSEVDRGQYERVVEIAKAPDNYK